jgi:hypothetical protein
MSKQDNAGTHCESVADGLEGLGRARSFVLVGVELQGQLPVRLLQLGLARLLRHAEDLVVVVTLPDPAAKSKVAFRSQSYDRE